MAISKPGTGFQNEPPSLSNRLLAPPSLSLTRNSSNSKAFVGWPPRGSALRYASGCSVHGVKRTGQRKKCRCNQESRPARHSLRAGNRFKNKPGQHKDMKDTQEDASVSQHPKDTLDIPPRPRKAHRRSLWSNAKAPTSAQPEVQGPWRKLTQVTREAGRLCLNRCEAGALTLTLHYLGDVSFAGFVVTRREKYFKWKAVTLQGSSSITWGQRPSRLSEGAGVKGRGQRKDPRAFEGGYPRHNRTCKMELLCSLKPPSC